MAAFRGREYAVPDDVVDIALPALRHRVILTAESEVEGHSTDDLLRDQDSTTLISLKAERDHLRRLINSDWANPEEELKPILPH